MNGADTKHIGRELPLGRGVLVMALGVICFQLAYTFHACSFLIAVWLWSLFQLTRLKTPRQVSYLGLLMGMPAYAPQLYFLWMIFGAAAIALWMVLAFWLRMFLVLGRACRVRFGTRWAALLMPFLWTGFEYFRSELYYLKFSWLNAGYVFSNNLNHLPLHYIGMYGVGFAGMALVSVGSLFTLRRQLACGMAMLVILGIVTNVPASKNDSATASGGDLRVAGVQMEFPSTPEVLFNLNQVVKKHPDAQLLVLSEYTFNGPLPQEINDWCKRNGRYLVVGAKDPASGSDYYDTAFVVGPAGDIVFRQGKSVPIQFFQDGLPAKEQKLWASPWGNLGFCVCYDLSYTRVTDRLIQMGAEAIIVPTMDVVDWGRHQHELHARVARIRAAEYGVPIFRVASSGISQCVNARGLEEATAPMPGDGAMLSGTLHLAGAGARPWDRFLAPLSVGVTGVMIVWLGFIYFSSKRRVSTSSEAPNSRLQLT